MKWIAGLKKHIRFAFLQDYRVHGGKKISFLSAKIRLQEPVERKCSWKSHIMKAVCAGESSESPGTVDRADWTSNTYLSSVNFERLDSDSLTTSGKACTATLSPMTMSWEGRRNCLCAFPSFWHHLLWREWYNFCLLKQQTALQHSLLGITRGYIICCFAAHLFKSPQIWPELLRPSMGCRLMYFRIYLTWSDSLKEMYTSSQQNASLLVSKEISPIWEFKFACCQRSKIWTPCSGSTPPHYQIGKYSQ